MADTLKARVERLEESERRAWAAIATLADKEAKLDEALATLADAQIETERRFRETDARFKETDARIEKLVTAIGVFLREGRA